MEHKQEKARECDSSSERVQASMTMGKEGRCLHNATQEIKELQDSLDSLKEKNWLSLNRSWDQRSND